MLQEESPYVCPISKKFFFDPVYLLCNDKKHIFEKEALQDKLAENLNCPKCKIPLDSKNQILEANDMKKSIYEAIQKNQLMVCNQYLPREVIFSLLCEGKLKMPLTTIEKILNYNYTHQKLELKENLSFIFLDNFTTKKQKLILYALKIQPQLMAYFLRNSIQTCQLKLIVKKLTDIKGAFNEITINQFITHTTANQQEFNSVSYLLLSNVEGREILKENSALCTLIGERLSEDSLKQFVNQTTHKGTLYYLLTDEEVGQKILKNHKNLRDKMSYIGKTLLSKQIIDGPDKGQTLQNLYNQVINSTSLTKRLTH